MVGYEVRQVRDLLGGKAADGGRPLGRLGDIVVAGAHDVVHVGGVRRSRFGHGVGVEADDVFVQEGLVVLALADDDVGDGACQGAVGAGVDREPLIGVARGPLAQAVVDEGDGDAGFPRLGHLVHFPHSAHARFARAAAEEQPAVGIFNGGGVASEATGTVEGLAVEAEEVVGGLRDLSVGLGVDGSQMSAGEVEQALDGVVAGSRCAQEERLGPVGVKGVTVLLGDDVERLVPADALELA